jgi:hypothetical protein
MLFGVRSSVSGFSAPLPETEALTRFFEQLRASQYHLDAKQLAASHRILLSAHAENWAIERLRFVLMLLFAKSRQEQIEFTAQFDRWLGISTQSKQIGLATRIARRTRQRLIELFVFVVALVVMVLGTFIVVRLWQTAAPPVIPSAAGIGRTLEPVGPPGLSDAIRVVAIVPLALFIAYLVLRWRRSRLWVAARASGENIEFDQIEVAPSLGPVFGGSVLYEIALELRRPRPTPTLELDIERTVEATARQAGHFSAIWRQQARRPEYVVLIEEYSYRDHIARIVDAGIDSLKKLEVGIQRYHYNSDPRVVVADDRRRTPVSLLSLAERERHARLIIFGSGRGLVHPLTDRLGSRLRQALEPWTDRILLSTDPVETWGEREHQLLKDGFSVGTASVTGLVALAARVSQGRPQSEGLLEPRLKISYAQPVSADFAVPSRQAAAVKTEAIVPERHARETWKQLKRRLQAVLRTTYSDLKRLVTAEAQQVGKSAPLSQGGGLMYRNTLRAIITTVVVGSHLVSLALLLLPGLLVQSERYQLIFSVMPMSTLYLMSAIKAALLTMETEDASYLRGYRLARTYVITHILLATVLSLNARFNSFARDGCCASDLRVASNESWIDRILFWPVTRHSLRNSFSHKLRRGGRHN